MSAFELEILKNPVACLLRDGNFEPFLDGLLLVRIKNLDAVAVFNLISERNDLAIDLRTDTGVADVGMDGVCEVYRRRIDRQSLAFIRMGEDSDVVEQMISLNRLNCIRIGFVSMILEGSANHIDPFLEVFPLENGLAGNFSGLIFEVSGETGLGEVVHLASSNLHFDRFMIHSVNCEMNGAITILLRLGNIVFEGFLDGTIDL